MKKKIKRKKSIRRTLAALKRPGKLSVALVELAEPLVDRLTGQERDGEPELDEYKGAYLTAALAWNLAVVRNSAQEPLEDDVQRMLEQQADPDTAEILESLVQRKLELFPDDQRFIVEPVVEKNQRGGVSLYVVSAPFAVNTP
jgi:hypothetical protein